MSDALTCLAQFNILLHNFYSVFPFPSRSQSLRIFIGLCDTIATMRLKWLPFCVFHLFLFIFFSSILIFFVCFVRFPLVSIQFIWFGGSHRNRWLATPFTALRPYKLYTLWNHWINEWARCGDGSIYIMIYCATDSDQWCRWIEGVKSGRFSLLRMFSEWLWSSTLIAVSHSVNCEQKYRIWSQS